MLRIEVSEAGKGALPAIDLDDAVIVVGSDATARVRLPATVARAEHVRIAGGRWEAVAPVAIDGANVAAGTIGDGVTFAIGTYRVRVAPAPPGATAAPPQRTESLARELMRGLLGDGAAPSLEVERGPIAGVRKQLAPPESTLVIGRGDDAGWIVLDEDLSRQHAEVQRGWDGTRIADLGSKNGTRVDGVAVGREPLALYDGALVELGKVALRFRDPAENHRSEPAGPPAAPMTEPLPSTPPQPPVTHRPSTAPFYAALAIMVAALAGLVWILSS
jgi:hypothetical protein